MPACRYVDEQFQGPAGSGGDRGKKIKQGKFQEGQFLVCW